MADRRGLRLVGLAYGGLTAIVMLVALLVVTMHVNTPVEARAGLIERLAGLPR